VARHPDFEKIYATFMQHYSKDPKLGEERYQQWLKDSGLDETKGYYEQGAERAQNRQSFAWADFLLQFVKEDKDAKYYEVEALFPVESMNKDSPPFTRDEVLQAARSLTGKPSDLNHDQSQMLEGVEIVAAQFEDDCVECLVRVPKNSPLNGMIERKEIVSVSIEGEWSHGLPGQGLVLTGLGWLTKKTTLPGIPLTRIVPVEQLVESFEVKTQVLQCFKAGHKGKVKLEAQQGDGVPACAICGQPADFIVSICQSCLDKAGGTAQQLDVQVAGEYFLGFMQDPNLFLPEHFRTVWLDQANGILAVMAKTRVDPAVERCQEILFLKSKWQPNTVADWLKIHPDYAVSAGSGVPSNEGEKLDKEELKKLVQDGVKEGLKEAGVTEAEWDTNYINNLPDDCFAYIEAGGQKDDQGKTTPRSLRHLPYKNAEGSLDADHVRNALARLDQTEISADAKKAAMKKLCAAAGELKIESAVCNLDGAAERLQGELTQTKEKLTQTEAKLTEANNAVEKLKRLMPGVDLLANPPKLMPVSETLERLGRCDFPPMIERISLGNRVQAQKVRKEIFEVKQKYGVA
jgi:hypothetical protein